MSSEFDHALRRLKPQKHRQPLKPRPESEMPFLEDDFVRPGSLLYDTTVYVDILQGRFPEAGEATLLAAHAWHSTVAQTELASVCALLDPARADSRDAVKQIAAAINRIPRHRTISPDPAIWFDAGILTGAFARLQSTPKAERRRILNDALIFATARKYGHAVLTRNIVDFDFLQQLDPSGRVLFYRSIRK